MTNFYPVFLNLTGRRCVIIGGGQIATGKISKLLDSGANIVVISPDVTEEIRNLSDNGFTELYLRKYQVCLLYTSPSPRDQRGSRMAASG